MKLEDLRLEDADTWHAFWNSPYAPGGEGDALLDHCGQCDGGLTITILRSRPFLVISCEACKLVGSVWQLVRGRPTDKASDWLGTPEPGDIADPGAIVERPEEAVPCKRCGARRPQTWAPDHPCTTCGSELCSQCCDQARADEEIRTPKPPPLPGWRDGGGR